jgi:hypothetical protein
LKECTPRSRTPRASTTPDRASLQPEGNKIEPHFRLYKQ